MNKLEFASISKALFDGTFRVYKSVNNFDHISEVEILDMRNEAYYELIKFCFVEIPYYKYIKEVNGFEINQFTDISSIRKLPILTKDILRENYILIRNPGLEKMKYTNRRSGGTTGEPIQALVSKQAAAYETFSYFRGLRWMGWKPEYKMVKLFGGSLGLNSKPTMRQRVYQWAIDSILIPAFEINNGNILAYYNLIKTEKEGCIIGYASAINYLATLLRANYLHLKNVRLVITTSEQLIEDWKLNILDYFNCEIRSYYGCGEIESIGYQLSGGDETYKIASDNLLVESEPITNELILTQFHNRAQPLIRFKNGDLGTVEEGNNPSKIISLIGRTSDYFFRKNGEKVSPIFGTHSILKSEIPVKQYQYVQYSDYIIEFRYLMDSGILSNEQKGIINEMVSNVFGEKVEVIFSENKPFEVSMSKKHRICVYLNKSYCE